MVFSGRISFIGSHQILASALRLLQQKSWQPEEASIYMLLAGLSFSRAILSESWRLWEGRNQDRRETAIRLVHSNLTCTMVSWQQSLRAEEALCIGSIQQPLRTLDVHSRYIWK
ncbi:hypothetical protein BofuT4_P074210.1 [Botrytis cinerea T4]|uniref:Uncharacterized protein n=1 Tax=Botryotinia fuckeliana (strain T4) TaxID=999810 RepID=G2XP13_BOTF4|nr:hypothetical protein BofuT4_P074210.1 [Botrytis cinerea T4]